MSYVMIKKSDFNKIYSNIDSICGIDLFSESDVKDRFKDATKAELIKTIYEDTKRARKAFFLLIKNTNIVNKGSKQ